MELELGGLYRTLEAQKDSFLKILTSIDQMVLVGINSYKAKTHDPAAAKCQIGLTMMEIIQTYINVQYYCERVSEKLSRTLKSLNLNISERYDLNSFFLTMQNEASPELQNDDFVSWESDSDTLVAEVPSFGEADDFGPTDKEVVLNKVEIPENRGGERVSKTDQSDLVSQKGTHRIEGTEDVCLEINEDKVLNRAEIHENIGDQVGKPDESDLVSRKLLQTSGSNDPAFTRAQVPQNNRTRTSKNKNLIKTLEWQNWTSVGNASSVCPVSKQTVFVDIADSNLSAGDKCVICHVESPSEFYVRVNQNLFERFESQFDKDMNEHVCVVVNHFPSKNEARACLGQFCCGFLETENKWYRIEVVDWQEDEPDSILVQFIDYGKLFHCSYKKLKPLRRCYSSIPKMAIRCHVPGRWEPPIWLRRSVDERMYEFVVVFAYKEGNSYAVNLHRVNAEVSTDLTTESLELREYTTQGEPSVLSTLPQPQFPAEGSVIQIFITGYLNSCHFYAHILEDGFFNPKFRELMDLANFNNRIKTYKDLTEFPQIGKPLLCKRDEWYYRAKCLCYWDDQVEVFLYDVGETIKVKLNELKQMDEEFLHLSGQAIECILFNCKEKEGVYRTTSRRFFEKCLGNRVLNACVVKTSNPLQLKVWDSQNLDMKVVLHSYGLVEDRL